MPKARNSIASDSSSQCHRMMRAALASGFAFAILVLPGCARGCARVVRDAAIGEAAVQGGIKVGERLHEAHEEAKAGGQK